MKILLIGEYSNVHWTLAEGLRRLGHRVTVLSGGDFWKDYPRDIDLSRRPGRWGGVCYIARLLTLLPRLRGYDVVQLINPMFLELRAERLFPVYRYLRRHNRRVYLGAFGMDYYWVSECVTRRHLRYSDFNIGDTLRTDEEAMREREDWVGTAKERLNVYIARDCDGIVAGLYEYFTCYQPRYAEKMVYIPYPVRCKGDVAPRREGPLRLFIGINRSRSRYKGTDIMLRAAEDVARRYPERVELRVAESVPFAQYCEMMNGSDAILDQLYSYTPAMNALEAMSRGIVCVGGGEPEHYALLGETRLRPIVNVEPTYESVYAALEHLALHPEAVNRLRRESAAYIAAHHDHIAVARRYLDFWQGPIPPRDTPACNRG